ncbi:MAG: hypothetical protein MAG715_00967 [Methanonatronarchaeales archaeon]|nr:hypothetical protein [Methanonatronarchaeales archaeon]
MKDERVLRYREKVRYIRDSLMDLPERPKDELEVSGVFYRLHTAIEAAMDLLAMMLKDLDKRVEDDYTNIETLKDGPLSSELAEDLKRCNGLRNHLVHRYNSFDEDLALESVDKARDVLGELSSVVEEFLDERED